MRKLERREEALGDTKYEKTLSAPIIGYKIIFRDGGV